VNVCYLEFRLLRESGPDGQQADQGGCNCGAAMHGTPPSGFRELADSAGFAILSGPG
jgi:hypothetical protein